MVVTMLVIDPKSIHAGKQVQLVREIDPIAGPKLFICAIEDTAVQVNFYAQQLELLAVDDEDVIHQRQVSEMREGALRLAIKQRDITAREIDRLRAELAKVQLRNARHED